MLASSGGFMKRFVLAGNMILYLFVIHVPLVLCVM